MLLTPIIAKGRVHPNGKNHGLFLYDSLAWIYFVVLSQQKTHFCLPTNVLFLFIQAAGLAYHRRAKRGVYHQGRQAALASHHAPACIFPGIYDGHAYGVIWFRNG